MSKFLSSLGIAQSELRLLDAPQPSSPLPSLVAEDIAETLTTTGEFQQGVWHLPSGETIGYEMVSWESKTPGPDQLWRLPELDQPLRQDDSIGRHLPGEELVADDPLSPLSNLPIECLARVAAHLSLADLSAVCQVSPAFRRLVRSDVCWVERLRSHFGSEHLRACFPGLVAASDHCCTNPFARIFFHILFGLYRARPEGENSTTGQELSTEHQHLAPEGSQSGALFPRPLLSPVLLGRPLIIHFRLPGVHPGRYDILLRVKKLLCDPLDSESVANAAGTSGVRVPLLQARINRRNVTISNFECNIEVTTINSDSDNCEATVLLSYETVSHLLQNYTMPPDRWFYWRLALLDLHGEASAKDLRFRVTVMRRGIAETTVTQDEFERELRNALLIDHLFLRLQQS